MTKFRVYYFRVRKRVIEYLKYFAHLWYVFIKNKNKKRDNINPQNK